MSLTRPGFFFLVCPDSELVRRKIEELLVQNPAPGGKIYERLVFWGEDGLSGRFWESLTLQSLLGAYRAIVIRHAEHLSDEDWSRLSAAFSRPNAQSWPFVCLEVEYERNAPKLPKKLTEQKCWEFGQKKKWIWKSAGLGAQGVRAFVESWAASRGLRFRPRALEALCAVLPADAVGIDRELAKIELSVPPRGEIDTDAAQLVTFLPEMNIFELFDALARGTGLDKVWGHILQLQESGEKQMMYLVTMLAREARILWQVFFGGTAGVSSYRLQAKQQLAARLGTERLSALFDLALQAELGIKRGEYNEMQAQDMLIAGLSSIFQPGAAASSREHGGRGGAHFHRRA